MTRKVLHIVCQAHLDPVWLWPWRDGCSEALTTMQSALDRMTETPGMCFTRSSAIVYRWAERMDPRLFAEVGRRIAEGRWEIAGGWVVQPDCNIPSTESFVRQALYGKRYIADRFGVEVAVGYNVDSFGHAAGLPQLLARAGYKYYVMMRPHEHEYDGSGNAEGRYPTLFWWESPDGSRVLTWRIPTGYGQSAVLTPAQIEERIREAAERCVPPGFDHGLFFLGVGNHGGGPTRRQIETVLRLRDDKSLPELRFSTLASFFGEIERASGFADLPVVRGELQHHARGCYAAMGEVKALNRRAERGLVKAEALAVMAAMDVPHEVPRETLREAWWRVLFNQFHDILAGTSVEPAYRDVRDTMGAACAEADAVAVGALHAMARRIDTADAPEGVLFAMNPLPWPRSAVVQLDTFVSPHDDSPVTHLQTPDGCKLPLQWTSAEASFGPCLGDWKKLTAVVDLPPCGYRAFHLAHGDAPPAAGPGPEAIQADETRGGLASLRADGAELLAEPAGLVVIADEGDTWAHGVDSFRNLLGRPALISTRTLEDGPVVRVVRQRLTWQWSTILLDLATYRDLDAVELCVRLNWQESRQILKLEIPTRLDGVRTFAKIPGGYVERAPTGGEEPVGDWVALEGRLAGESCSLGLINDAAYSADCLDRLLRAMVVRSAPFAEHDPVKLPPDTDNPYLDQGGSERRFWLVRAKGPWTALNLPRRAEAMQTPAEYVVDSAHPGDAPWERSYASVTPENVVLTALKRAEDGSGTIIRLHETLGQPATARVTLGGWRHAIEMGPRQLRTLRVSESGEFRETDLIERAL